MNTRSKLKVLIKKLNQSIDCDAETIINELLTEFLTETTNITDIRFNPPKDIKQRFFLAKKEGVNLLSETLLSLDNKEKVISNLQNCLSIVEETRRYITNRAREELSQDQHDAVYEQLNSLLSSDNTDVPNNLNWAEVWLMWVELNDRIDQYDNGPILSIVKQ